MKVRSWGRRSLGLVMTSILAWVLVAAGPTAAPKGSTQEVMAKIFASLQKIMPLSLSDQQFYAPQNKDKILDELKSLKESAHHLDAHAVAKDETYAIVSRSFRRDAENAYEWYAAGRLDESRYMLHNITENCISCHLKGGEGRKFPGLDQIFAEVDQKKLLPVDQARFQVATRQFEGAALSFEGMFVDPKQSLSDLVFMDAFSDYYKIVIRVLRDYPRALKTLDQLLARQDKPAFIEQQLRDWRLAVEDLKRTLPAKAAPSLDKARALVSKAEGRSVYPRSRDGMIYFIAAAGELRRLLDQQKLKGEAKAEAYYLLGVIEDASGRSFWVSESQALLEAAIRAAPRSKVAQKAYHLLEESLYLDYSGSSGTHLPDEEIKRLDVLRKMALPLHGAG